MAKAKRRTRRAKARPRARRKAIKVTRRTRRPRDYGKSSWTIRFRTERELLERLEGLVALFEGTEATGGQLEGLAAGESCLSLIQSVQIVAQALAPKTFTPTEKLADTYLTSQERELFRARAVKGVSGAGCQISETDVPAEEGTTHSAVVGAIRDNAHG
jgi:hypothetical protein